jgi:gluconolactonase
MPSRAVSRRAFLKRAACSIAALGAPQMNAARLPDPYAGLRSDAYFDGAVRVETALEHAGAFMEGPAVDGAGRVFFSDVPGSKIYVWDAGARQRTVFREDSRHANGLLFDAAGRLLACEGGAGRITRTDMHTGAIEVLADAFAGRPLQAPNDLALDGPGRVYFSSRAGTAAAPDSNPKAVYRLDPSGRLVQLLREPDVDMPNGLVTAPDDRTLYLIESHPEEGRRRSLWAYDLNDAGTLSRPRRLYDFYPGRSGDGMCVDATGNLYVAAGLHRLRGTSETLDTRPGIHVFTPEGMLVAFARTPEDTVTNCTFGGADLRTLYITCGRLLLSVRTRIPGKATYRPQP